MRTKFVIFLSVVFVALVTGSASAGTPTREFIPAPPFDIVGSCPFIVHAEFPVDNEYAITFTDANGNPTMVLEQGKLIVKLTNADTGSSLTLDISGPGRLTFGADGFTTLNAWGNWLIYLPPDFFAPGSAGIMIYNQGRLVVRYDASALHGTILSQTGTHEDLCAALS